MRSKRIIVWLMLALLLFPLPVDARAGGGGSGGSGGGGGGSSSTPHASHSGRPATWVERVVSFGSVLLIAGMGGIVFAVHLHKKRKRSLTVLEAIDDLDYHWNEAVLDQRVKDVYFGVQRAWSEKNLTMLQELLSEHLYEQWRTRLSFMELSHEQNILEDVELLDHKIVSVHDYLDDTRDECWYYIKGRMIDYTIDTESGTIKTGSTKAESFVEYWRFIRKDKRFVLDEIAQSDEKRLEGFNDFSESMPKNDPTAFPDESR